MAEAAASKSEEDGKANRTMWDFVNRGASAATGGAGLGGKRDKREDARLDDDLDNMLDELDVPARGRKSAGRGRASVGGRRSSVGDRNGRERHSTGGGRRSTSARGSQRKRSYGSSGRDGAPARRTEVYSDDEADAHRNDDDMDFGGDDGGFDVEPEADSAPVGDGEAAGANAGPNDADEETDEPATQPETQEHPAATRDSASSPTAEPSQEGGSKPKGRRPNRLAGRLSAAQARAKEAEAKRAEEERRKEEEARAKTEAEIKKTSSKDAKQTSAGAVGVTLDVNSRSFQVSRPSFVLISTQARAPNLLHSNPLNPKLGRSKSSTTAVRHRRRRHVVRQHQGAHPGEDHPDRGRPEVLGRGLCRRLCREGGPEVPRPLLDGRLGEERGGLPLRPGQGPRRREQEGGRVPELLRGRAEQRAELVRAAEDQAR